MILAWCLERSLYLVCLVACVLLAFSLVPSFIYYCLLNLKLSEKFDKKIIPVLRNDDVVALITQTRKY